MRSINAVTLLRCRGDVLIAETAGGDTGLQNRMQRYFFIPIRPKLDDWKVENWLGVACGHSAIWAAGLSTHPECCSRARRRRGTRGLRLGDFRWRL